MKKIRISALLCAAALCSLCTACGGTENSVPVQTTAAQTADAQTTAASPATTAASTAAQTTAAATTAAPADLEQAVAAADDEAFLYINDGQFYIGYTGEAESSKEKPRMSYDAGVAKITGDGKYTVSVRNDTKALRLDATGEADGNLVVKGCQFAAVIIKAGTTLYPNMSIEINEIRKDGQPVEMTAKNYTSSDNGKEMRANIYNQWVNAFPDDAHTATGPVTGEFGEYSSQIIDPEKLGEWQKIEVDFTVTGCSPETTAPVESTAAGTSDTAAAGTTGAESTAASGSTAAETTAAAENKPSGAESKASAAESKASGTENKASGA